MYLLYVAKGVAFKSVANPGVLVDTKPINSLSTALFITITNANFDKYKIADKIREGFQLQDQLGATFTMLPIVLCGEPQHH
jgi:hydroxylamine reductase